jgi:hypothetical protein
VTATFFANVNYFTFDLASPVQDATYRTARADFNVRDIARPPRRHTPPAALFFLRCEMTANAVLHPFLLKSSQVLDLRSLAIAR